MEGSLGFLFAAVLATWLVIFLYLLSLGGRLAALQRELEALRGQQPTNDDAPRTKDD
ncbi:MAG TPA: CcmD family protein [Chloroflexota bacterium]|nr:CcmD family protein [Chloroflexota bacterium]